MAINEGDFDAYNSVSNTYIKDDNWLLVAYLAIIF